MNISLDIRNSDRLVIIEASDKYQYFYVAGSYTIGLSLG